jgi:hypothetical protein
MLYAFFKVELGINLDASSHCNRLVFGVAIMLLLLFGIFMDRLEE